MTTWLEFRSEPLTQRPNIDITHDIVAGIGLYEAECPVDDCDWVELGRIYSEVEEQVYAHEQWHEDGMPE